MRRRRCRALRTRRAGIDLDKVDLEDHSVHGFKILCHRLVTDELERICEVPICFGQRDAGDSKATLAELKRYLLLVPRLRLRTWQRVLQRSVRTPFGKAA